MEMNENLDRPNYYRPKWKKLRGCLTAFIVAVVLFFGLMIYSMISARRQYHKDWDKFDDERISYAERILDMELPDDVTAERFICSTWLDSYVRFWVSGIDDPQKFLEKAYPAGECEISPPTGESLDWLADMADEVGAGHDFTEMYDLKFKDRNDGLYDYGIGFGKNDGGYYAVIGYRTY